jgi:hypothetical protein
LKPSRDNNPNPGGACRQRSGTSAAAVGGCIAALAVGVAACGGSSHSHAHSEQSASTTPVTNATTTPRTTRAAGHNRAKHPKPASHTHTTRTSTTHTTPSHTTTTHASTTPNSTTTNTTYARPLHATLVGENHDPTAGKLWTYTVTATDANGRPLPGTVDTEFTFEGVVVGHESPPTHPLTNGRLRDQVTFPPDAVGHPIDLQVVVHTPIGSITLDWPVVTRAK